jgi:putative membrane protein
MLLQIILALLLGVSAGTLTGLIPGIHVNLIGTTLVSLSLGVFSGISSVYLVVFITSMSITHTFLDFIPSIFLGCPDTDTELSVLPGHELLKKGEGYGAILLTSYGSIAAIFVLLILIFPSLIIIPRIFPFVQKITPLLLILISFSLILTERKKLNALIVFFLSGFLGLCVLNMEMKEPLLPLLTGLFGSSMLIISIKEKVKIPEQKIEKIKVKLFRPLLGAVIASPLCSFLPGLGSGQAAIIGNQISGTDKRGFLVLLGATNTLVMGFSFLSLYLISRTRTGSALAIKEIIGIPSNGVLILIFASILFSGIISFFLTKFLARYFSKNIRRINYALLSLITILILVNIIAIFSGFLGLIILTISTLTGIYCISLKVRRTNMMGCLLIPVIIFYLTNRT